MHSEVRGPQFDLAIVCSRITYDCQGSRKTYGIGTKKRCIYQDKSSQLAPAGHRNRVMPQARFASDLRATFLVHSGLRMILNVQGPARRHIAYCEDAAVIHFDVKSPNEVRVFKL